MTKMIRNFAFLVVAAVCLSNLAMAQQQPAADKVLVKLQVVISRYDGDRKISSLPFTVLATANGNNSSIRIGANVPITTGTSTTYSSIGTDIDCKVATEAGRYKLDLTINDTSVIEVRPATTLPPVAPTPPSFRSFKYTNTISLKDGETKQFVSAADKSNGEAVKVDVTLTLDK